MKKLSIACGLLIASGSLFAQQYSITTIAGSTPGWSGDSGPALSAQFNNPLRVALDSQGNIYVNDFGNSSIREIFTDGTVRSLIGTAVPGYSGDGGQSNGSQISSPHDIALDANNNLYIADTGNSRIRIISGGKVRTFAGSSTRGVLGGNLGDGGLATSASFILPTGVAVDKAGNVYISDIGNATVRKVSPSGTITAFAGTGFLSFGSYQGEGGPATKALLGMPYSLTTDSAGNLYIVDIGLSRLFKIGSDGIIHTVSANFPAQNAVVDDAGNIYAANYSSNTVVKVLPNGTTLWIGGNGISGNAGDGGPGTSASMAQPYGVALDKSGNVYVAEGVNAIIRKLTPVPFSIGAIANSATNQPFAAPLIGSGNSTVPISPGEIVTIFGVGLGPASITSNTPGANGNFGTSLAGTKVTIGGVDAPLIYVSSTLVSAIVPYAVSGRTTADVYVTYNGNQSAVTTVPVAATAPGLFTLDSSGAGQGLAVNVSNGKVNGPANAAGIGGFVILYATGEGQTTPAGVDGKPAPTSPTATFPTPTHTVTATVSGIPATVTYAGGAPGFVAGVMQVNLQIPIGVAPGSAQVFIFTNGVPSPVNIYVSQ